MFYMANHFKRAYGFFKCQVCLSRWTSSLAWAKKTDSGRIGYRYGQICKSVGCEGSGHRIYVKPYELIFLTDPDFEPKTKNWQPKRDHIAENCEMCNMLGGRKNCFQLNRSAKWRQANEASAAYQNQPDLV